MFTINKGFKWVSIIALTLSCIFANVELVISYDFGQDVTGFQFDVNGVEIVENSATGGGAGTYLDLVQTNATTVIGISFSNTPIPAGAGVLTTLTVIGDIANATISNVTLTDMNAQEVASTINGLTISASCVDAGLDDCGVCFGDGSSCADCAGVPNGSALIDDCGVCGGDGLSCASPPSNLFFSEHAEGSSSNKYFEVYNASDASVDLADYSFVNCSNACTDWVYTNSFADGATIASGSVYVVCHSSADANGIIPFCNETRTLYHNGNDAQGLIHNASGTLLDVVGDIATSGTYWDVAGVTQGTKDHTLVRKATVLSGNTDWVASAGTNTDDSEWAVFDQNTWNYIGNHPHDFSADVPGCTNASACNFNVDATIDDSSCLFNDCAGNCGGTSTEDACGVCDGDGTSCSVANLFFSEAAEGSSNNKYLEIYNASGEAVSLSGYAFPSVSNAPTVAGEYEYWNNFSEGAVIAPGDVYVVCHGSADALISAECDQTHNYLSNGDDGYCLVFGNEGGFEVLDCVGDWNGDPGSGWAVAGVSNATQDHTIVRKSTVLNGTTDWVASAGTNSDDSEWVVFDQNTWDYLGSHPHEFAPPTVDLVISYDFGQDITGFQFDVAGVEVV
nr:lamin tail domain-containing protein [Candidatus Neomarinimicrobiota bacterium]